MFISLEQILTASDTRRACTRRALFLLTGRGKNKIITRVYNNNITIRVTRRVRGPIIIIIIIMITTAIATGSFSMFPPLNYDVSIRSCINIACGGGGMVYQVEIYYNKIGWT